MEAGFIGTRVQNPFGSEEDLDNILNDATEIPREVFCAICEVGDELFRSMVEYPNDFEFHKSAWDGKDIWFFTHSGIEVFYMGGDI